jgi:V/A-type H+-transporting ATPase subunit F
MSGTDIAVLGCDDFVIGFRLAGIRRIHCASCDDIEEKIVDIMADPEIGILVMDNEDMKDINVNLRRKMVESVQPVVIAIGRVEEVDLRERIKQAVGVDLWK